jgi:hypothetical protein
MVVIGPETATCIILGSMSAALVSPSEDGHGKEEDVIRLLTQFTFICGNHHIHSIHISDNRWIIIILMYRSISISNGGVAIRLY